MKAWIRNNWQVIVGVGLLTMLAGWSLGNGPRACAIPGAPAPRPLLHLEGAKEDVMSTRVATKNSVEYANEGDFAQLVSVAAKLGAIFAGSGGRRARA